MSPVGSFGGFGAYRVIIKHTEPTGSSGVEECGTFPVNRQNRRAVHVVWQSEALPDNIQSLQPHQESAVLPDNTC